MPLKAIRIAIHCFNCGMVEVKAIQLSMWPIYFEVANHNGQEKMSQKVMPRSTENERLNIHLLVAESRNVSVYGR